MSDTHIIAQQRQVVYWRMLAALFGHTEQAANIEHMAHEICANLNMPPQILDARIGIATLIQRYPELGPEFELSIRADEAPDASLRRALIMSKLLLNMFGPNTQGTPISAAQYSQWVQDVAALERACGQAPGTLRTRGAGGTPGMAATGAGAFDLPLDELQRDVSELESDLIRRMALHDLLQDNRLAAQLKPSIGLVEQLLSAKGHLSGQALANARRLIQQYVDELAEVLRLEVARAGDGHPQVRG